MVQQVIQKPVLDVQRKGMGTNEEYERNEAGCPSPIRQFFQGRSVFITGATGFVGKILVEKLLRCCPEIEKMYLLMRTKKGLTPEQRIKQLLQSELFNTLREITPNFEEKITIVCGDIGVPNLGLSDENLDTLRENVSVIFHSAARPRFDDHLRISAHHHITATKLLIELCQTMPKIASFIHVSTAYVQKEEDGCTVPERVLPGSPITADQLIQALEWMDDETVSQITPYLLRDKYVTYALTKALAENIVADHCGNIPTGIVRPCVVGSTWKEPFPGWCDTIQGPNGMFLAAAKGFLRTLHTLPGVKIVVIPADIVVNTIIATAWFVAEKSDPELFVVNCVYDDDKMIPASEETLQMVMAKRDKYPLANMYRYPDFTLYNSRLLYKIHAFFDQYLPAFFFDILLFIFTGKPFMLRLYKKIETLFDLLVTAAKKPWIIKNANYHLLEQSLSKEDRKSFFMDMAELDWDDYLDICLVGGRKFLAHEDPSNIPYAKKKAKIWWFVTTSLKWMIIFGSMYYFFSNYIMSHLHDV